MADSAPMNGHAEAAPADATPAAPNPVMDKYTEQWKTVQENPSDFNTWTALISTTDKLEDLEKLRGVYDAFLALYPLCYGYWKKYADAENKAGNADAAAQVYERGVQSVPFSVDLWGHYATFKQAQEGASPEDIRGIYERGVAYVGTDYNAHGLWDKYLAYEGYAGSSQQVAALYTRLLACPIKELDRYYTSFKEYAAAQTGAALMSAEEFSSTKEQLEAGKREAAAAAQKQAAAAAAAQQAKQEPAAAEGEAAPGTAAAEEAEAKPDVEMSEAPAAAEGAEGAAGQTEAMAVDGTAAAAEAGAKEEAAAAEGEEAVVVVTDEEVKGAWVHGREELYKDAREALTSRKPFEDAIRRPYFHVKPLDAAQLVNWAKYLDAIEARGDSAAAVILYERCLVPCASYPEFWCRYVRCLEALGSHENAEGAVQRATLVYCKARPEMHLFAARYLERRGKVEEARAAFAKLTSEVAPRNVEVLVAAASFERRQGDKQAACALFESLLGEERSRESFKAYAFLAAQYSLLLRQAYGDLDKARQVVADALALCGDSRMLWEAAIHLEEVAGGQDMAERVMALYARCTAAPAKDSGAKVLTDREREELSLRAVDFADMYGSAAQLLEAERQHAKQFMLPSTAGDGSRKRGHEEAGAGGQGPHKVMRPDTAAAGAAAPAAAAAAAAYGHYPPAPAAAAGAYPGYNYGAYGQYPGYGGYGYGY